MATTTIPWGDGSGDNIYLTYSSASGDQAVSVSSDANTGDARSKIVTFSSGVGNITKQLTVSQAAGGPSYVKSGLILWLDGIDKGPDNSAWVDKISGYSFTNNGATFNSDHVSFDGIDDYMENTDFNTPQTGSGTMEICYEDSGSGTRTLYFPSTGGRFAFGIYASGNTEKLIWTFNTPKRSMYGNLPSKGTVSISTARALGNGSALTASGTDYWSGATGTNLIGCYRSKARLFTGKVYSIRFYNRQLTLDEALANLAVDNERFNLGLSL